MKSEKFSIKWTFRFIQLAVIISTCLLLAFNTLMIWQVNQVLEESTYKNDALNTVYSYTTSLSDYTYRYVLNPSDTLLEHQESLKEECLQKIDVLIDDVMLKRTRVMLVGLRNMYLNSFQYADAAILAGQQKDTSLASVEFQNLNHSIDLINDTLKPMHALYSEDINTYLEQKVQQVRHQSLWMSIAQIFAVALILVVLIRQPRCIRRKIDQLTEYANDISRQKYNFKLKGDCTGSRNELDNLGITMMQMAKSIQRYIGIIEEKDRCVLEKTKVENEYLKLQSTLRDAQMKALNSQMNPHFLYNTLGVVSQLSYLEGAKETGKMLDAVIDAFQYITRTSSAITDLRSEIAFLENYFYIYRARYEGKISFRIDVNEQIPNIKLPGMILQPIVENSILHGLRDCVSGGVIHVAFHVMDKNVYIVIEDNGVGMEYETMEELLISENNESQHIGISNVLQRLKLYFGEKADIIISSEEDCGTIITVMLPT